MKRNTPYSQKNDKLMKEMIVNKHKVYTNEIYTQFYFLLVQIEIWNEKKRLLCLIALAYFYMNLEIGSDFQATRYACLTMSAFGKFLCVSVDYSYWLNISDYMFAVWCLSQQ